MMMMMIIVWFGNPCTLLNTLQNVIQTQKCEPCQHNKLSHTLSCRGLPVWPSLIHTPESASMAAVHGLEHLVMMAQRLARRDWRSGGPRFKSHPRLTFQSWSSYQLNQLGSKAASDSTLKQLTTCGVSNTCTLLYFYFFLVLPGCPRQHRMNLTSYPRHNGCV